MYECLHTSKHKRYETIVDKTQVVVDLAAQPLHRTGYTQFDAETIATVTLPLILR